MRYVVKLVVAGLVSISGLAVAGAADAAPPNDGCPDGFALHHTAPQHEHDDHHDGHRVVGNTEDRNGDGMLCVKHVGADNQIHVHIDNTVANP